MWCFSFWEKRSFVEIKSVQQNSMIMLNSSEGRWQVSKVNPPGFQLYQDVCLSLGLLHNLFLQVSGLLDSRVNCQQLVTS